MDFTVSTTTSQTIDSWPHLSEDKYAQKRIRKAVDLLRTEPGHTVLDVGCHQEEAKDFLPVCEYIGLDLLKGNDFDQGFNLHRQFDRILCLETLEHLKYPRRV